MVFTPVFHFQNGLFLRKNDMEKCQELILDDVIRIDIYRSEDIRFSVPFNATAVTYATCTIAPGTSPALVIRLQDDSTSDVVMEPAPKVQVTEKRENSGLVRTHTLEAVISEGFSTVQSAIDAVAEDDTVAIMTTYEGVHYAIIPFPNTGMVSLTDSRQQAHTQTVKYTAQSFSGLVAVDISQDNS